MPDRQQDHSLGEGGLMFGKYITVYDGVWSAEVLKLVSSKYEILSLVQWIHLIIWCFNSSKFHK